MRGGITRAEGSASDEAQSDEENQRADEEDPEGLL
jgi:hypothetical protein